MSDKISVALDHAEAFWQSINEGDSCECEFACSCLSRFKQKRQDIKDARTELTSLRSSLEAANKAVAEMRNALESAKAAVWDAHYGNGIAVEYAQNIDKVVRSALASDCGKDWVRKSEVERLEGQLHSLLLCAETRQSLGITADNLIEVANLHTVINEITESLVSAKSLLTASESRRKELEELIVSFVDVMNAIPNTDMSNPNQMIHLRGWISEVIEKAESLTKSKETQ